MLFTFISCVASFGKEDLSTDVEEMGYFWSNWLKFSDFEELLADLDFSLLLSETGKGLYSSPLMWRS